jgi:hypothetical protein
MVYKSGNQTRGYSSQSGNFYKILYSGNGNVDGETDNR